MLSITGTLLLFLGDFVSMSISTDNVRSSLKPDAFDMRRLFGVSGSLGVLMTIENALFAVPALSYFWVDWERGANLYFWVCLLEPCRRIHAYDCS
jgi:H+-transporting ATPase